MLSKYMVMKTGEGKESGKPYSIAHRFMSGISKKTGKPYSFVDNESSEFVSGYLPIGTLLNVEKTITLEDGTVILA